MYSDLSKTDIQYKLPFSLIQNIYSAIYVKLKGKE